MIASYNFNISSCNCSESFLVQIESCIVCSKLILEKYYGHSKVRQLCIMELYTASQNKFTLVVSPFRKFGKICAYRENNPLCGTHNAHVCSIPVILLFHTKYSGYYWPRFMHQIVVKWFGKDMPWFSAIHEIFLTSHYFWTTVYAYNSNNIWR